MAFCNKCGTKAPDGSGFCHTCGTPMGNTDQKAQELTNQDDFLKTKIRNHPTYGVINLEDLPQGHVVDDRYEVKAKIGQGGFGAVYRAYDRKMKIDKALKVLPEAITCDREAMESLGEEAATMVRLNHPNIVRVYDFQEKGPIKYIDMEYVDGKTLTDIKLDSPTKKLPEGEVKKLAVQIATGLAYAHSKKIIHKDIKPQNILLSKNSKIKIMDFGISETVRSSMSRVVNSSSAGTLIYMAPEQIKGKNVGQEADIFSFGISLYELLAGKPPFNKGAIEHQILNEKPRLIDDVSAEMNAVLQKCLEKDYTARFRSFKAVLNSLTGAPVKEMIEPVTMPEKKTTILKWLIPLGALLVSLMVFLLTGDSENKPAIETAGHTVKTIPVKHKAQKSLFQGKESEAGYNKKISDLDGHIWSMQKRLDNGVAESGDSLKAMNELIVEKAKETKKRATFILNKKVAKEKRVKEEREQFIVQLKEDIKAYHDVISSEYGENMKGTAWKALAGKYPERSNGVKLGDTTTLLYGFAILNIKTKPEDVDIEILNSNQSFKQNMKLKGGKYRVKVVAKNYIGKEINIELKAGELNNIEVHLVNYPILYVATDPKSAKVRFLDVNTDYKPGSSLKPGKYRIKIEANNCIAKEVEIVLEAGKTKNLNISLRKFPKLFVTTEPVYAKVKILDVGFKYKRGVSIKPGFYTIVASAKDRVSKKVKLNLSADEVKNLNIELMGYKYTNSRGMQFVYIKPGNFNMGSNNGKPNEKPVHRVDISKGFYLQTTEVTQGQWYDIMGTKPWLKERYVKKSKNNPAVYISWSEAKEFIRKLNMKEGGNKYRLPTEAEWEFSARGGSSTKYCFGDNISQLGNYGWYYKNTYNVGEKYAHEVGLKKANQYGLYDMHGNVWEWVEDRTGTYSAGEFTDPVGSSTGYKRVFRGGSWNNNNNHWRSASRNGNGTNFKSYSLGFRLYMASQSTVSI